MPSTSDTTLSDDHGDNQASEVVLPESDGHKNPVICGTERVDKVEKQSSEKGAMRASDESEDDDDVASFASDSDHCMDHEDVAALEVSEHSLKEELQCLDKFTKDKVREILGTGDETGKTGGESGKKLAAYGETKANQEADSFKVLPSSCKLQEISEHVVLDNRHGVPSSIQGISEFNTSASKIQTSSEHTTPSKTSHKASERISKAADRSQMQAGSVHTARFKSSPGDTKRSAKRADRSPRKPPRSPSKMQANSRNAARSKPSLSGSEHSTQSAERILHKPQHTSSKMQTRSEHTTPSKSLSGSGHSTRSAENAPPKLQSSPSKILTRSEHTARSKSLNGSEHGTRRVYLSKVPGGREHSARSISLGTSEHTTVSTGSVSPHRTAPAVPKSLTQGTCRSPSPCRTGSAIQKASEHSERIVQSAVLRDSVHSTRKAQRSTNPHRAASIIPREISSTTLSEENNSPQEIQRSKSLEAQNECQDLVMNKIAQIDVHKGDVENGIHDAAQSMEENGQMKKSEVTEQSETSFLRRVIKVLVLLNCLRMDTENGKISTNWARCLQWLALCCDMVAAIVALVTFSDVTHCCGTEILDIAGDIPWRNVTRAATYIYLLLIFAEIYPVVHRGFPLNLVNPLIGFLITFAMFFDDSKNQALAMWGVETTAITIEYVLFRVKLAHLDAKDDKRIELKALLKDGRTEEPDEEQEKLKKEYEALKVEIAKDRMMLFYLRAGCYLNIFLCLIILALIIFVWQSGGLCMSNFEINLLDLKQLGRCPLCTNHSGVCEICTEEVTQCYFPYS